MKKATKTRKAWELYGLKEFSWAFAFRRTIESRSIWTFVFRRPGPGPTQHWSLSIAFSNCFLVGGFLILPIWILDVCPRQREVRSRCPKGVFSSERIMQDQFPEAAEGLIPEKCVVWLRPICFMSFYFAASSLS